MITTIEILLRIWKVNWEYDFITFSMPSWLKRGLVNQNKDPEIDDLGVWEYIILLEYWTVHQFDFTAKQDILHHDLSHFEQIVLPFLREFLFES